MTIVFRLTTKSVIGSITFILILAVLLSVTAIPHHGHAIQAYNSNSSILLGENTTNNFDLDSIPMNKVNVGDIDISYKIFGEGNPILLINGAVNIMDSWPKQVLESLAKDHTVIVFDNRGMGNTSSGVKEFTIKQFMNDTIGLMDALKINKTDILGYSMGGMIAQELALAYPDKVGNLIILGSSCGGKEAILPSQDFMNFDLSSPVASVQVLNSSMKFLYPETWIQQNPDFIESFIKDFLSNQQHLIPAKTIDLQSKAIVTWQGVCDKLSNISSPTLSIVGTDDVITPPGNSQMIAEKIPDSWFVQIDGAGHGLISQYPEKFSTILRAFLLP